MKLKPILIFLLIFILGFGSGFLISGRLTKKRIDSIQERQTPAGFKRKLYKYLKPDNRQKVMIDSIVATYIPRIKGEREQSMRYQKNLRDSMFSQIREMIDDKQERGLKKFEKENLMRHRKIFNDTFRRGKFNTPNKKRRDKIRESLTPEQQQKFDSAANERRKQLNNPELKREIRVYLRKNMLPVIMNYRRRFDPELSVQEKETIEALRKKRNESRTGEEKQVFPGEDTPENGGNMKAFRDEAAKLLADIITNHKVSLDKIAESLEPERQIWETGLDAIKSKYIDGYKPGLKHGQQNKLKNTVDFLLMDPKPGAGRRK